jgi:hypothetical protein
MPRRASDAQPPGGSLIATSKAGSLAPGLATPELETLAAAEAAEAPAGIPEAPAEEWGAPRAVSYAEPEAAPRPAGRLDDPEVPSWLAFNRVKGIGPARFRLLLDAFGTAEAAWGARLNDWQAAGLDARTAAALEHQRRTIVPEAEVERLVKLHVGVLCLRDPEYPRLLRESPLPPPVLYVRGTLAPADEWAVAIVDTRRANAYGHQVTERLARELAE